MMADLRRTTRIAVLQGARAEGRRLGRRRAWEGRAHVSLKGRGPGLLVAFLMAFEAKPGHRDIVLRCTSGNFFVTSLVSQNPFKFFMGVKPTKHCDCRQARFGLVNQNMIDLTAPKLRFYQHK